MSRHTVDTERVSDKPEICCSTEHGVPVWEVPTSAKTRYLSHGYFRYIGKFPPQIARRLILDYSMPGDLVLDPMCGGGTVLIESRLLDRKGHGIDVNPVSILVSKVTTSAVPQSKLVKAVTLFLDNLEDVHSVQTRLGFGANHVRPRRKPKVLDLKGHEHYFDTVTLDGISAAFEALDALDDKQIHDFILVGLLSILRLISHANVKKMNLELDMEKTTRKPLIVALKQQLEQMTKVNHSLASLFVSPAPKIVEGFAQETNLKNESVDLVIVHPPYMTNTAFSEVTQLQLAVLGISHKDIWRKELRARGSFLREPDGVRKYIIGWNCILKELRRVLRKQKYIAVVIGDGQVEYTRIPMGAITEELAIDLGFSVSLKARHRLNNNTGWTLSHKMRDQHILVLQK